MGKYRKDQTLHYYRVKSVSWSTPMKGKDSGSKVAPACSAGANVAPNHNGVILI